MQSLVCTLEAVEYPDFYDTTTTVTADYNYQTYIEKIEHLQAPGIARYLTTDGNGRPATELIIVEEGEGRGGYIRRSDDSGKWQRWETDIAGTPGFTFTPEHLKDTHRFCRSNPEWLDLILEFQFIGEDDLDGVAVLHFRQRQWHPSKDKHFTRDYWIDGQGFFRKVREIKGGGDWGEGQRVEVKRYSGWGEINEVILPENPLPVPER